MTLPSSPPPMNAPTQEIVLPAPSRWKSLLARTGWISLGVFCLLFFTLVKLPDEQIRAYIQNTLASELADQGVSLTAEETSLSFLFGATYSMKGVTLTSPTGNTVQLEKIAISPSVLPLFLGKLGASFTINSAGGMIKGSVAMRKSSYSFSFNTDRFDLKKSDLLSALGQFAASGLLTVDGNFSGNVNLPNETDGSLSLTLQQAVIEPQSIMGFTIPRISLSESKADLSVAKGKVQIRSFSIGKPSSTDDIRATISGDITLAQTLEMSSLNIKTKFSLSESILQSFVLLDTLMAPGKQPDGSYGFQITGLVNSPNPVPLAP